MSTTMQSHAQRQAREGLASVLRDAESIRDRVADAVRDARQVGIPDAEIAAAVGVHLNTLSNRYGRKQTAAGRSPARRLSSVPAPRSSSS